MKLIQPNRYNVRLKMNKNINIIEARVDKEIKDLKRLNQIQNFPLALCIAKKHLETMNLIKEPFRLHQHQIAVYLHPMRILKNLNRLGKAQ